jgi:NAD(P)H-nitrite reductase large subunit
MYGGVTNSQDLRKIADVVDKYEIPLVKMTGGQSFTKRDVLSSSYVAGLIMPK